jgi:hypothetical protein
MTKQTSNAYRDVLDELAKSRGLSGAEELAEKAADAGPVHSRKKILDGSSRAGRALDAVLDLTEEERRRISEAWAKTYLRSL